MRIAQYSVERPISILMITVSVLVLGVLSWNRLPLDLMPQFTSHGVTVSVSYPSSSPEEVDRNIARPLEEYLATLNHLESISSTSASTGANVRLDFKHGTDMDLVSVDVRDRIDQVRNQLPDDIERVRIRRFQSSDIETFEFSLAWEGHREELYKIAEEIIRPRLERISGVASVEIEGVRLKEITVEVDQNLLESFGVDIGNLAQSLRANNINVSGGFVRDSGKKYSLRTIGEFLSVDEIAMLPVAGGRLILSDLAQVKYDYPEQTSISRLNGRESISIEIYKSSTANVVEVCSALRQQLQDLQKSEQFQGKLSFQIYDDQSVGITSSMDDLKTAGAFGGVLAMIVLFLFLRKLRSTLIISLAIPVSVVFTFAFMYLLNVFADADLTLNVVSLMGLMVSVGMLLDASIVVLENIFRHKQDKGMGAKEAAIVGSREVGLAVLASTATTVVVFVAFIFVPNSMTGRYMRDFGITVSVALIASLIVAVTLIPLLSSRILSGEERPKQKSITWLTEAYGTCMSWLLRWRFVSLVLMAAIGYSTYVQFQSIDRGLFPRVSERQLRLSVLIEPTFTLEEMEQVYDGVESLLLQDREQFEIVAIASRFSNRTGLSSRYSGFRGSGRTGSGQFRGALTMYLEEEGDITPTETLKEKIRQILPLIPGVEFKYSRMRFRGGGGSMGAEVQLVGDNPAVLEQYAEIVRERLQTIPQIKDVETSLESGDQEIHLIVDRNKSEKLGISPNAVARTIASALSTRASTRYKGDDREIDVIVQLKGGNEVSLQELQNIRFANREGALVPLHSVVDYRYERGPMSITREDRKSRLSVTGNTDGAGMFMMQGLIEEAMSDVRLPAGYEWNSGGMWRRFLESEDDNFFGIALAIIFMYIIMAALFESFTQPLTILFCVPFSLIGVAVIYNLTNTSLTSTAYLGILVLFGIVVNNGIILVNHVNALRGQGIVRDDAIVQGGKDRLRPILMTAFTSLIGLLPLTVPVLFPDLFGAIEGRSRQWSPVSLAVLGGLTTSTFLTLIILPTIYSYVDDLTNLAVRAAKTILRWVTTAPQFLRARS